MSRPPSPLLLLLASVFCTCSAITVGNTESLTDTMLPYADYANRTATLMCGSDAIRANSSYASFEKVWRFNEIDIMTTNPNYTLLENGTRLQINSVDMYDMGVYDCCVRANIYVTAYNCYRSRVQLSGMPNTTMNSTMNMTMPKAWNVDITATKTLYAKVNETYYLKLWNENVTNVTCTMSNGQPAPALNTTYPSRAGFYDDVLVVRFKAENSGGYSCGAQYPNATMNTGATTMTPIYNPPQPSVVTFQIVQSDTMLNPGAQQAPPGGVHENDAAAPGGRVPASGAVLLAFFLLLTCS